MNSWGTMCKVDGKNLDAIFIYNTSIKNERPKKLSRPFDGQFQTFNVGDRFPALY